MKTFFTFFVLLFSSKVVAEIYICSQELSRYNRAGEIETTILSREGDIFKHEKGWVFFIIKETDEVLILQSTLHWEKDIYTILIDKLTLEWTSKFLDIQSARDFDSSPNTYGNCKIL